MEAMHGLPFTYHIAKIPAVTPRRFPRQSDFVVDEYLSREISGSCWLGGAIDDSRYRRVTVRGLQLDGEGVASLFPQVLQLVPHGDAHGCGGPVGHVGAARVASVVDHVAVAGGVFLDIFRCLPRDLNAGVATGHRSNIPGWRTRACESKKGSNLLVESNFYQTILFLTEAYRACDMGIFFHPRNQ